MNKEKALEKFKEFCQTYGEKEEIDEQDWHSLSIGFFFGIGLTNIEEIYLLASESRYKHGYWAE